MVISDKLAQGIHVSLNYFGIELWAQSLGYLSEASPEFIAGDTDHQYVQHLEEAPTEDTPASSGSPSAQQAR